MDRVTGAQTRTRRGRPATPPATPPAAADADAAAGEVVSPARRHPAVTALLRHFDYRHLPDGPMHTSRRCHDLAYRMVATLPDDPELTAGLRKLLEAEDCFVRAARPAAAPDGD